MHVQEHGKATVMFIIFPTQPVPQKACDYAQLIPLLHQSITMNTNQNSDTSHPSEVHIKFKW